MSILGSVLLFLLSVAHRASALGIIVSDRSYVLIRLNVSEVTVLMRRYFLQGSCSANSPLLEHVCTSCPTTQLSELSRLYAFRRQGFRDLA